MFKICFWLCFLCGAGAFASCRGGGCAFTALHRLLLAVASCCRARALRLQQLQHSGCGAAALVALKEETEQAPS